MIKYIFSGLQETLLDQRGRVSQTTVRTVRAHKTPLTLISMQSPSAMKPAIQQLGLRTLQVAFNGGLIFAPTNAGVQAVGEFPINHQIALPLLRLLRNAFATLDVIWFDDQHCFTNQSLAHVQRVATTIGVVPNMLTDQQVVARGDAPIVKIEIVAANAAGLKPVHRLLRHLAIPQIQMIHEGACVLSIFSVDARVPRAIDYILARESLLTSETAGFEGCAADLAILKMVGTPIAVANANAQVKQFARYMTRDNRHDGVAYALQHYNVFEKYKF